MTVGIAELTVGYFWGVGGFVVGVDLREIKVINDTTFKKMTLKEGLLQLGARIESQKEGLKPDEAQTKLWFINPWIELLGYKISEMSDVVPEFQASSSGGTNHRVDYMIRKDGSEIFIIECKKFNEKVAKHGYQLSNYFNHLHKIKLGILTNGITYYFYSDVENNNVMDSEPFFEFNITDFNDEQAEILEMFSKSKFDEKAILEKARKLTYIKDIKKVLYTELTSPSKDFIKYIAEKAYLEKRRGSITEKVRIMFAELVNISLPVVINQLISNRIIKVGAVAEAEETESEGNIVTTQEEIDAYLIIKAIIRKNIAADRILYKDHQNYFSVRIDGRSHNTICRLYLNSKRKQIRIYDSSRAEQIYEIAHIDQIYDHSEKLLMASLTY